MVKFIVTPSLMVARGWGFWSTVIITSSGAAAGVWVFFYFGKWILRKWAEFRGEKEPKRPFLHPPTKTRGSVSSAVWHVGTARCEWPDFRADCLHFGSCKYYERHERMPWILVLAFVVWSFILTALSFWFIDIG